MSLIRQSQLEALDLSKIKNLLYTIKQSLITIDAQTDFIFTLLNNSVIIAKAELYINGVLYEEQTSDDPEGSFTRNMFDFQWAFTEANGGFDIVAGMSVTMMIYYYQSGTDVAPNITAIGISNIEVIKTTVGDWNVDPVNYYEQYNVNNLGIQDFIGLCANSALYTHPFVISYEPSTGVITLRGECLTDNDSVVILASV
jgi:hypothetical protein